MSEKHVHTLKYTHHLNSASNIDTTSRLQRMGSDKTEPRKIGTWRIKITQYLLFAARII